jgi:hypothetical protein
LRKLSSQQSHFEEEEEWHQEQLQMQQQYDERIAQLEKQQRVVIREPYLSDEKKDKLREIVGD